VLVEMKPKPDGAREGAALVGNLGSHLECPDQLAVGPAAYVVLHLSANSGPLLSGHGLRDDVA